MSVINKSQAAGLTTPHVVALVSCGKLKAKTSSGLMAKDLYIGVPFQLSLKYATDTADDVFILSALHGVISPYQQIKPYDVSMPQKTIPQQNEWGKAAVTYLQAEYSAIRTHIVFYAGMQYVRPIMRFLPGMADFWTWENPLEGKDLFKRIKWLKQQQGELDVIQR